MANKRIGPARLIAAIVFLASAGLMSAPLVHAQRPDPNSPRYKGVTALSEFLTSKGDDALAEFVKDRVSPGLQDSLGQERLTKALSELRSRYAGARRLGARRVGSFAASIEFSNGESISFEMEAEPPHRFVRIGSIGEEQPSADVSCGSAPRTETEGVVSLARLDEKLRAEAASGSFSGVALIAKDGEPIFHEAYGYADKNADLPNRLDTKFNLGSINKLFTTVAVYQLLEAGKLNLDDTIGKYLPQFPPAVADSVTVKHLLDHRSGWGAYWDNPTWNARRSELRSLDDYMAFIKDIPLDFEPGTRMQYSNTGYEVLGAIVQKASGQSYYDYVRDHIYKPARMNSTDAYDLAGDTPNLARGYAGGGYGEDNSTMLAVRGTAAGGGFSTAGDLMRFVEALGAGRLISPKHANRLLHGSFAGGGPGVNAALHMNVSGNHTVVVLSNFDPPAASQVARMLSDSVAAESGVKQYRIGVAMIPHQDGVAVDFLVPGGPGEKGGLEPEDVIVAMNGSSIADDPIGRFDAALTRPDPIKLQVRRGDTLKDITITPELKGAEGAETTLAASGSCRP